MSRGSLTTPDCAWARQGDWEHAVVSLGNVSRDLEAYETALQHYLKHEDIRRSVPRSSFLLHAHRAPLMGIATTYSKLGNHQEALHYYRQALDSEPEDQGTRPTWPRPFDALQGTRETEALTVIRKPCRCPATWETRRRSGRPHPGHYGAPLPSAAPGFPCRPVPAINRAWPVEERGLAGRQALLEDLGATCWNLSRYEEAATAFEQDLQIVESRRASGRASNG